MADFEVTYGKFGSADLVRCENMAEAGRVFRKVMRQLGVTVTISRTEGTLFFAKNETYHLGIHMAEVRMPRRVHSATKYLNRTGANAPVATRR